jgi:hypothetical protein
VLERPGSASQSRILCARACFGFLAAGSGRREAAMAYPRAVSRGALIQSSVAGPVPGGAVTRLAACDAATGPWQAPLKAAVAKAPVAAALAGWSLLRLQPRVPPGCCAWWLPRPLLACEVQQAARTCSASESFSCNSASFSRCKQGLHGLHSLSLSGPVRLSIDCTRLIYHRVPT